RAVAKLAFHCQATGKAVNIRHIAANCGLDRLASLASNPNPPARTGGAPCNAAAATAVAGAADVEGSVPFSRAAAVSTRASPEPASLKKLRDFFQCAPDPLLRGVFSHAERYANFAQRLTLVKTQQQNRSIFFAQRKQRLIQQRNERAQCGLFVWSIHGGA